MRDLRVPAKSILWTALWLPCGALLACSPAQDDGLAQRNGTVHDGAGMESGSDFDPQGPQDPAPAVGESQDDLPPPTPPTELEGDPSKAEETEGSEHTEEASEEGELVGAEPEPSSEPEPELEPEPEAEPGPVEPARRTARSCFTDIEGELGPDYDRFEPRIGEHCQGTAHQEIAGIERLVFLGDSVTAGTPPTMPWEYYSARVAEGVMDRFGLMEVSNCAQWGARTDDLLIGKREIEDCFPDGGDQRRTLVIMTVGGNDIAAWAQDHLDSDAALQEAEAAAALLEDAIHWLQEPGRFPNGVYVVFANPYEYTDATGDLAACPLAGLAGMEGNWIEGADAVIHFQERFMEIAVETGTDLIFSLERFCGHGFRRDDPSSQCYRGPDAELWFDLTCIHPNPAGHAVLAEMFMAIIDGGL